jgi:hypothetical protein
METLRGTGFSLLVSRRVQATRLGRYTTFRHLSTCSWDPVHLRCNLQENAKGGARAQTDCEHFSCLLVCCLPWNSSSKQPFLYLAMAQESTPAPKGAPSHGWWLYPLLWLQFPGQGLTFPYNFDKLVTKWIHSVKWREFSNQGKDWV